MDVHADQLKEFAEELASRAAHLVWTDRRRAAGGPLRGARRTPVGLISPAALGAERLIKELVWEHRPGDGVLGRNPATPGQITWVVDPLNGEVNYTGGLPGYAVSVAAMLDDVVLAGAVAEPHSHRVWSAGLGQGARLHDHAISDSWLEVRVASTRHLDSAVVGMGFSSTLPGTEFAALMPQIGAWRRSGCPALDLVHVAAGWTDAFIGDEVGLRERAAGLLIAEEAGATVSWPGRSSTPSRAGSLVLASAPRISEALLDALGHADLAPPDSSPHPPAVLPRHTA
jgi:myo-inositol-1(or 4)-monophosphatase